MYYLNYIFLYYFWALQSIAKWSRCLFYIIDKINLLNHMHLS